MRQSCGTKLPRAIEIADFILEGHNIMEAADEFGIGKTTVERDLNMLGSVAFYGTKKELQGNKAKELQTKYLKVRKTLKSLALEHNSKNIVKWNEQRKNSK